MLCMTSVFLHRLITKPSLATSGVKGQSRNKKPGLPLNALVRDGAGGGLQGGYRCVRLDRTE